MRVKVPENIKRMLYAESMGRCMNPDCRCSLFRQNGDVIEKAHIHSYCKSKDNSFENLVVLCPSCHTDYDKNETFSKETVIEWKETRKIELEKFFTAKFDDFSELKDKVQPYLMENKIIYENYYLKDKRKLWDLFVNKVIVNNRIIKLYISNNLNLFQDDKNENYSNKSIVNKYLLHIDEFETAKKNDEVERCVLFPEEVNSIFSVCPVDQGYFASVQSLEALVQKKEKDGFICEVNLGVENPCINIKKDNIEERIYLNDLPNLRQMYFDNNAFRRAEVRFDQLNYILKFLNNNSIPYKFEKSGNYRKILIKRNKILFVYEYCLSGAFLRELAPEQDLIIVNLHNWNGDSCISSEAKYIAKKLHVNLYTQQEFYGIARKL